MRIEDLGSLGISCIELPQGVSFVMESDELLSVTGYKVLVSQEHGFVPCVRSRLNGREKLTYLTGTVTSLALRLADSTQPRLVQKLLCDFVEAVQMVCENGFLGVQGVLVTPEHIYVDVSTGECLLVCLPLAQPSPAGDLETLRATFDLCEKTCARLFGASSPLGGVRGSSEYQTGDLAFLHERLSHREPFSLGSSALAHLGPRMDVEPREQPASVRASSRYRLSATRGGQADLVVTGSMVVGKSPQKADRVILGNPAISRRHCRLGIFGDGLLGVEDLGSVNGTFVNGRRLAAGRQATLSEGDVLRLADVEFVVSRER